MTVRFIRSLVTVGAHPVNFMQRHRETVRGTVRAYPGLIPVVGWDSIVMSDQVKDVSRSPSVRRRPETIRVAVRGPRESKDFTVRQVRDAALTAVFLTVRNAESAFVCVCSSNEGLLNAWASQ